ncbi:hypothetical protein EFB08_17245 [Rufibacter latericius]|uniref:Uncharacterized protein n=1 Tax=Rufibacter latericius TaxID=2487040 RepID=A0A3M9MEY0_9BACT|nr:hypothetical protein EFB08_17245 [Rufibacter latericius]
MLIFLLCRTPDVGGNGYLLVSTQRVGCPVFFPPPVGVAAGQGNKIAEKAQYLKRKLSVEMKVGVKVDSGEGNSFEIEVASVFSDSNNRAYDAGT